MSHIGISKQVVQGTQDDIGGLEWRISFCLVLLNEVY